MREGLNSASVERLIDGFARLPGIGRRTAQRLAFHILLSEQNEAMGLANAIRDVKEHVRHCSICFNLTESDPCALCSDPKRDRHAVMVVEQPRDVITLEESHAFRGVYHVLMGRLSPLEGVGPANLTIDALIDRVEKLAGTSPVEVILGTNPNLEGDGTALYLTEQLEMIDHVTVTRLARGLPNGSQLEFANKAVLSEAINSRKPISGVSSE
jgi:recombination protein RecR